MFRCLACGTSFPTYAPVCSWCWAGHSLVLAPERPRAAFDGEPELLTARELAKTTYQSFDVPAYPGLVLKRGALVVLVGKRGSGKSTMAARMLDSIPAQTLLVSVEEPAGPSVAARLARIGAHDDRMLVCSRATVDQLVGIVRKHKVAAIGVDSAQRALFEARDLRHLLVALPTVATVVAVSQVNRDGDVRGGEELAHECDVLIEVEDLHWKISKSRYQPEGEGAVLASPQSSTPQQEADHGGSVSP